MKKILKRYLDKYFIRGIVIVYYISVSTVYISLFSWFCKMLYIM